MNIQRVKRILPSWKKIREVRKLAEIGMLDSADVKFFLGQGLIMLEGHPVTLTEDDEEGDTKGVAPGKKEKDKVVVGFIDDLVGDSRVNPVAPCDDEVDDEEQDDGDE